MLHSWHLLCFCSKPCLSLTVEYPGFVEACTLWILGRWKFECNLNALLSQLITTDDIFQVKDELKLSEVLAQQIWMGLRLCQESDTRFWCYQTKLWSAHLLHSKANLLKHDCGESTAFLTGPSKRTCSSWAKESNSPMAVRVFKGSVCTEFAASDFSSDC